MITDQPILDDSMACYYLAMKSVSVIYLQNTNKKHWHWI